MNNSETLIYQAAKGKIKIDVRLEDETVRLSQDPMARLSGKSKKTISEHIRYTFSKGELDNHWPWGHARQAAGEIQVRAFVQRPDRGEAPGGKIQHSQPDSGFLRGQGATATRVWVRTPNGRWGGGWSLISQTTTTVVCSLLRFTESRWKNRPRQMKVH